MDHTISTAGVTVWGNSLLSSAQTTINRYSDQCLACAGDIYVQLLG